MNKIGVIDFFLIGPIAKLLLPTNWSQFRWFGDLDSDSSNDYKMNEKKSRKKDDKLVLIILVKFSPWEELF